MNEESASEPTSGGDFLRDHDEAAGDEPIRDPGSEAVPLASSDRSPQLDDVIDDAPFGASPNSRGAVDPAASESMVDLLTAIRQLDSSLSLQLMELKGSIDRELRAEASREKIVDRLHGELQEYKQDLLLSMMRPVFLDLIQLHDDVGKVLDTQPEASAPSDEIGTNASDLVASSEDTSARLRRHLEGLRQGIEDILYRQGVEPFSTDDLQFDARRQRAVATVPTDDRERNRTVAVRLRKGFQSGAKVVRPELVTVYAADRGAAR